MAKLHNFVALGRSVVVDLDSKMVLLRGHFEYDECSQGFGISYDPDLNNNKLWREITGGEIRDYYEALHIPRPKDNLVPNISKSNRKIPLLSIDVAQKTIGNDVINNEVALIISIDDIYYKRMIRDVRRVRVIEISNNPENTIENAINMVIYWYKINWKIEFMGSYNSASIFIGGSYSSRLPNFRRVAPDSDDVQPILIEKLEN